MVRAMTDETAIEDQPEGLRRFLPPWWTLGFPLVATAGVSAWLAANRGAGEDAASVFLTGLLWPGAAVFALVLVIVWLGWVLEID